MATSKRFITSPFQSKETFQSKRKEPQFQTKEQFQSKLPASERFIEGGGIGRVSGRFGSGFTTKQILNQFGTRKDIFRTLSPKQKAQNLALLTELSAGVLLRANLLQRRGVVVLPQFKPSINAPSQRTFLTGTDRSKVTNENILLRNFIKKKGLSSKLPPGPSKERLQAELERAVLTAESPKEILRKLRIINPFFNKPSVLNIVNRDVKATLFSLSPTSSKKFSRSKAVNVLVKDLKNLILFTNRFDSGQRINNSDANKLGNRLKFIEKQIDLRKFSGFTSKQQIAFANKIALDIARYNVERERILSKQKKLDVLRAKINNIAGVSTREIGVSPKKARGFFSSSAAVQDSAIRLLSSSKRNTSVIRQLQAKNFQLKEKRIAKLPSITSIGRSKKPIKIHNTKEAVRFVNGVKQNLVIAIGISFIATPLAGVSVLVGGGFAGVTGGATKDYLNTVLNKDFKRSVFFRSIDGKTLSKISSDKKGTIEMAKTIVELGTFFGTAFGVEKGISKLFKSDISFRGLKDVSKRKELKGIVTGKEKGIFEITRTDSFVFRNKVIPIKKTVMIVVPKAKSVTRKLPTKDLKVVYNVFLKQTKTLNKARLEAVVTKIVKGLKASKKKAVIKILKNPKGKGYNIKVNTVRKAITSREKRLLDLIEKQASKQSGFLIKGPPSFGGVRIGKLVTEKAKEAKFFLTRSKGRIKLIRSPRKIKGTKAGFRGVKTRELLDIVSTSKLVSSFQKSFPRAKFSKILGKQDFIIGVSSKEAVKIGRFKRIFLKLQRKTIPKFKEVLSLGKLSQKFNLNLTKTQFKGTVSQKLKLYVNVFSKKVLVTGRTRTFVKTSFQDIIKDLTRKILKKRPLNKNDVQLLRELKKLPITEFRKLPTNRVIQKSVRGIGSVSKTGRPVTAQQVRTKALEREVSSKILTASNSMQQVALQARTLVSQSRQIFPVPSQVVDLFSVSNVANLAKGQALTSIPIAQTVLIQRQRFDIKQISKLENVLKTANRQKLNRKTIIKLKQAVNQLKRLKNAVKQRPKLGVRIKQVDLLAQRIEQLKGVATAQQFKSVTTTRQPSRLKTIQRLTTKQVTKVPQIPKIIKVPLFIPIPIFGLFNASTINKLQKARVPHNVVIRKKGKNVKINSFALNIKSALGLGHRIIENSAARSFVLVRTKGKAKNLAIKNIPLNQYRFPKGKTKLNKVALVEKTRFAINTRGEKKGITFKGIAASIRSRSIKRALKPSLRGKRRKRTIKRFKTVKRKGRKR